MVREVIKSTRVDMNTPSGDRHLSRSMCRVGQRTMTED